MKKKEPKYKRGDIIEQTTSSGRIERFMILSLCDYGKVEEIGYVYWIFAGKGAPSLNPIGIPSEVMLFREGGGRQRRRESHWACKLGYFV